MNINWERDWIIFLLIGLFIAFVVYVRIQGLLEQKRSLKSKTENSKN